MGSPNKQGKEDCHGAPLGLDEITLSRTTMAWTDTDFIIAEDVYKAWDAKAKGQQAEAEWNEVLPSIRQNIQPKLLNCYAV